MSRKRNIQVLVRFDRKEYESMMKKVKKSGMARETYIRHLIEGTEPKARPPKEYFDMMQQLYRIGINLNQIAEKAHTLEVIDEKKYDEAVSFFIQTVKVFSKDAYGVQKG